MLKKVCLSVLFLLLFLQVPSSMLAYADETDFVVDEGVLVRYEGTSEQVAIPDGITKIADSAFANNLTITQVTVPEGVVEIGEKVFQGCTNLSQIHLPNSLSKIGFATFDGCSSLESLTLPIGMQTVYTNIFADVDQYFLVTPGPDYAYFKESYIKELTIQNPHFVLFTEEEPVSQWGDPMSKWPECLVHIEKVYGYMDCGAEQIAPGAFVSLSPSLDNVTRNISNAPEYIGDLNGDHQITSRDAMIVLNCVVKLNIGSTRGFDMNGDGAITAEDALQILRYAVQLDKKTTYQPDSYETHQFTVNAKFQMLEPDVVNETKVIESVEALESFLAGVYDKYQTEENTEDFEVVRSHFRSMDSEYFKKNVCVITVDAGKLEWRRYKANTFLDRKESVGDKIVRKCGLVMNYYVETDTPVQNMSETAIYILVSGTTIPRDDLKGKEFDYVTFRRKGADQYIANEIEPTPEP